MGEREESRMKRWNCNEQEDIENPLIDAFLIEIIGVCKKHGFSIQSNDEFIIEKFNDDCIESIMQAEDNTTHKWTWPSLSLMDYYKRNGYPPEENWHPKIKEELRKAK